MTTLPALLDCRGIMEETGVKRHTAEQIMRAIPKVTVDGVRKVYVRREDVLRYIEDHTKAA